MTEADSFIEEVTEEVRRDRLFALMRKYGWIAILAVVLIVGGAAWNEWRKASERAAAQALGDAITAALAQPDAAARLQALTALEKAGAPGSRPRARVIVDLLIAAQLVEAGKTAEAIDRLDTLARAEATPPLYRDLAALKAEILKGGGAASESAGDRDARLQRLRDLATPGRPFRVLALEQIALVQIAAGDRDAAIASLREILDDPAAGQAIVQRSQQLIVALGGKPAPGNGG